MGALGVTVFIVVIVAVMVLIKAKGEHPNTTAEQTSQQGKTFANSNYKRLYVGTKAPDFQHDLLGAVNALLKMFSARINPALEQAEREEGVDEFMTKIQGDAFRHDKSIG